ncbi:MAG: MFS transporter [Minisyncoccia bacterium]
MKKLRIVFLASFFFALHMALVAYVHSSMLGAHVSANTVSVLFATASALSILLTLSAPRLMRKFGTVRVALGVILLSATLLWVLGTVQSEYLLLGAFVVYFALNACILYALDIFIEHYSANTATGNIRGLMLTIMNIGWVSMPVLVGMISTRYGFSAVYLISAVAISVCGIIIAISQRKFVARPQSAPNLVAAFAHIRKTPALRRVISLNFLLQFFFSWMALYVPLYLIQVLGFSWSTVGAIFSFMLLPFIIFPYPMGRLADKYLGEKELMITSLVVIAVAIALFAFVNTPSAIAVAVILFSTRIGASTLEIMNDSYFFKQVTDTDGDVISFYRIMQPFAYVIGPMTGAVLLLFFSYTGLFMLLAGLLLLGALYAFRIVDTR